MKMIVKTGKVIFQSQDGKIEIEVKASKDGLEVTSDSQLFMGRRGRNHVTIQWLNGTEK
jgi:hypothetical protein